MKLAYHNTSAIMKPHVHGTHAKDMVVLHETVSPDIYGWDDINGVEEYLASKDYGIHGMTDKEGHIAWALGLGKAIFWQAGGVNERSIGIEQVSNVMVGHTVAQAKALWAARDKQLQATARLLAAIHVAQGVPLVYSDGLHPGVTSHWDVSQHFAASEGHSDCHPVNKGGYYPIISVINLAKKFVASPHYTF